MTKFRVNDPVRITHSPCRYFDMVGTVADIATDQDHPFAVTGLEPWTLWFGPDEMVLAEHHHNNDERRQP